MYGGGIFNITKYFKIPKIFKFSKVFFALRSSIQIKCLHTIQLRYVDLT